MANEPACARIPSLALPLVGGGTTDLADFCGQKLVVFFCTADEAEAEIGAYAALAGEFEEVGAWIVGVVDGPMAPRTGSPRLELGIDSDGAAFAELSSCAPPWFGAPPGRSATFVIGRDSIVRAAWPGAGHAREALRSARERP